MPHTKTFDAKTVIISEPIHWLSSQLKNAYEKSGLSLNDPGQANKSEFLGDDKRDRTGLWNYMLAKYEDKFDKHSGARQYELPYKTYQMDPPAFELQKAYENYLHTVFYNKVTPENSSKIAQKSIDQKVIIDDHYVYLKEILKRLFAAAISIEKNTASDSQQAFKLIDCLKIFCQSINQSELLYDKKIIFWKEVSSINEALSKEHVDWICLLKNMQLAISLLHKHTQIINSALSTLEQLKATIILYLITYIAQDDIEEPNLLLEWRENTLLKHERIILEKNTNSIIVINNYDNQESLSYHTSIVDILKQQRNDGTGDKVERLYQLLRKTKLLFKLLQNIDMLLTMTAWTLIISDAIDFKAISKTLNEHLLSYKNEINNNPPNLKNKPEIKKSLNKFATNWELKAMENNFQDISSGLDIINNKSIKDCIINTIGSSLNTLINLEKQLGCKVVNIESSDSLQDSYFKKPQTKILLQPANRLHSTSPLLTSSVKKNVSKLGDKESKNQTIEISQIQQFDEFLNRFESILNRK